MVEMSQEHEGHLVEEHEPQTPQWHIPMKSKLSMNTNDHSILFVAGFGEDLLLQLRISDVRRLFVPYVGKLDLYVRGGGEIPTVSLDVSLISQTRFQ